MLVVVVLMIFMASAVFYMSPALKGIRLEEGASRFESLLKFASAEAAQSGKRVVIKFVSTNDVSGQVVYIPKVAIENDPIGNPGVFLDLPEVSWMDKEIEDLVQVTRVTLEGQTEQTNTEEEAAEEETPDLREQIVSGEAENTDTNGVVLAEKENYFAILGDVQDGTNSVQSTNQVSDTLGSETVSELESEEKSIIFYPDGSSETIEIEMISCDEEDTRKVIISLNGVTGLIEKKIYKTSEDKNDEDSEEEGEELLEEETEEGTDTLEAPQTQTTNTVSK
ncbi:MAG: hypothetical protein J5672_03895 [Verrucomicrobia bacterium]|nr:hypothetical protein [Verrucomicrobiota bacterium]